MTTLLKVVAINGKDHRDVGRQLHTNASKVNTCYKYSFARRIIGLFGECYSKMSYERGWILIDPHHELYKQKNIETENL